MRKRLLVLLSVCLVAVATALLQRNDRLQRHLGLPDPPNARIIETYGRLPLRFEANHGQTDAAVKFLSRGSGYCLFLTSNEVVLSLPKRSRDRKSSDEAAVLRMKLVGANPSLQVTGVDELPGKSNYLIGNDPAKWYTNVPGYARVRYKSVYSGVDLVYYGNHRQLEYDFVVAPGADPRAIRLAIDGYEKLRIDGQGDLVLESQGSEVRLHRPVIYQDTSGGRDRVGGKFVIRDGGQLAFEVDRYDASKPLIIDPILSYFTYLGGINSDSGVGVAVDSSGNAYVAGFTSSTDFPTANAPQAAFGAGLDAFVTKLNAAGSALVYSTYVGGSGADTSDGIALDSSGNAYLTGTTNSTNFPTVNPFQAAFAGGGSAFAGGDAFVTKLNAAGSALVYSTYLGGSGTEYSNGIAVDSSGNAFVTGGTISTNFPTLNPLQAASRSLGQEDAFLTKLNAAGSALVYSTYLGAGGIDLGRGIAVDSSGNAYIAGTTTSANFPTASPFQAGLRGGCSQFSGDAFVTKVNAAGAALIYSTYLGGRGCEENIRIALDSSGSAYITGTTNSTDFPTANPFQAAFGGGCTPFAGDAFVTKLDAAGSALVYSTYLGGSGCDDGLGIAVDSIGNAYVTGATSSTNFPTENAFQTAYRGGGAQPFGGDAFVTKLNAAGSALAYSTYLGSSSTEFGYGIAVDSSGNAYVTGDVASSGLSTENGFQTTYGGNRDAFVMKFYAPNPTISGIVNGASFAAGAPVAPGSIVSIFGFGLASSEAAANSTPLPTRLLTTSVTINGGAIPLYFVSPTQINAQIPFEIPMGTANLAVTVEGAVTPAFPFPVAVSAPGIFQYGANRAVAQNPDASINASDHPARPGEVIVVYMTGQGAVSNPVPTGSPALADPLSWTLSTTTATMGGTYAETIFSGLTPGLVGLLQVNIRIPDVPAGDQSLVVVIGGVAANSALITVASP